MKKIKWAILGCGHIANTFVSSMSHVQDAEIVSCASSDYQRAKDFAQRSKIPHYFDSYNEMLQKREIDAVYIATTHNFHNEQIEMCLRHGKHVLCEKPLVLNATQAQKLYALAEQNRLLLIEAVWTRFLPAILSLQDAINNGVLGDVQCIQANFSLNRDLPKEHRLRNKSLAGGALLDLGIYPISFSDLVMQCAPSKISTKHIPDITGVDKNSFYTLEYKSGAVAQLSAGYKLSGPTYARVMGTKGFIEVPHFLGAQSYSLHLEGKDVQNFEFPFTSADNFTYEIKHFNECLQRDDLVSDTLPAATCIRVMSIMDQIREQWGLVYDNEETSAIS